MRENAYNAQMVASSAEHADRLKFERCGSLAAEADSPWHVRSAAQCGRLEKVKWPAWEHH